MISLTTVNKMLEAAHAIDGERGLDAGTRSRYIATMRLMLAELLLKVDDRDKRKLYQLRNEVDAL